MEIQTNISLLPIQKKKEEKKIIQAITQNESFELQNTNKIQRILYSLYK